MSVITRDYVTVEPLLQRGRGSLYVREFSIRCSAFRARSVNQLVRNLWPWEIPPVGGYQSHYYQLSSDQQHALGTLGIWALAEGETLDEYRAAPHALFFRTLLPGRAILLGHEGTNIWWLDNSAAVAGWFSSMQETWGERYHGVVDQTRAYPGLAPLN